MPIPGPVNYTVKQVSFRVVRENAVATMKPILSWWEAWTDEELNNHDNDEKGE